MDCIVKNFGVVADGLEFEIFIFNATAKFQRINYALE